VNLSVTTVFLALWVRVHNVPTLTMVIVLQKLASFSIWTFVVLILFRVREVKSISSASLMITRIGGLRLASN
jgi:hypothetical protein